MQAGVFSESHIAIIMREILLGLKYLHGEGKLHRGKLTRTMYTVDL
jgi:serine/threonine-protein kinase 24/25/MST4